MYISSNIDRQKVKLLISIFSLCENEGICFKELKQKCKEETGYTDTGEESFEDIISLLIDRKGLKKINDYTYRRTKLGEKSLEVLKNVVLVKVNMHIKDMLLIAN